jgi:hypothetical protein
MTFDLAVVTFWASVRNPGYEVTGQNHVVKVVTSVLH